MPKPDDGRGHSFWSGTISFGLVTVPVTLFPANRTGGVHSRMLGPTGTPLRRRFFCPREEKEVPSDELVRGYEISDGEYVVVTDEELESLAPRKSSDIDVREFVNAADIEPLYFERSYFLTPGGRSNKAYRLLAEVMERRSKAGIATFVMREKEYLIAIFAENGILRAETLRFQDEVRDAAKLGIPRATSRDKSRIGQMEREIAKLRAAKLKPEFLEDAYARDVKKVISRKSKQQGATVKLKVVMENEDGDVDLLAVIKRSLRTVENSPSHPSRGAPKLVKRPTRTASRKATVARRKARS